jgi:hypothetical protein
MGFASVEDDEFQILTPRWTSRLFSSPFPTRLEVVQTSGWIRYWNEVFSALGL